MSLNPSRDLREFISLVHELISDALQRLSRIERKVKNMPTRDELNQVKAELRQAIIDEAAQVAADIQALKDQLNRGEPITQEDLDDLRAAVQGVAGIDPDQPPPTP